MPAQSGVVTASGNNFLVPNGTFIAEIIAFLIILGLLYRYVIPVVSKSMTDRQETIRRQIEDSREAKERLEAAEAEYKQAMADNRTEAARIREEARAQGQQIIDEMRQAAQEEAERVSERERARMESERQQMVHQLRAEVGQIAVELAGRVVGESLSDDARQSRIVDRFLAELDESAAADAGNSAAPADPA
ncbi:MAG: F0F1 ATP synthase subunit B, partial [Mycobacteriales bacterium]